MAIYRTVKTSNYTVIDNSIFMDYSLSMKATGLLCKMLSLPDGWNFSIAGLTSIVADGESAVRSALKELEDAGYFHREQVRDHGKIVDIEYVVYEKPLVENPQLENLVVENNAQLNTKELNTNKLSKKDIYTEFENLWSIYPKKQGKENAYKHYEKARKNGTTYEEVYEGISKYNAFLKMMETDMRFVKQGSTFFSQKAWQDEYPVTRKSTNPFTEMLMKGDY